MIMHAIIPDCSLIDSKVLAIVNFVAWSVDSFIPSPGVLDEHI